MLKIIRNHNYLNGHVFSCVEYVLVAGVLMPFAVYYFTHGKWLYAAVAAGIIANCLTVACVALVSILRKENGIGVLRVWRDKELRREIIAQYPHLSLETAILSTTIFVPFWIFGSVIRDSIA